MSNEINFGKEQSPVESNVNEQTFSMIESNDNLESDSEHDAVKHDAVNEKLKALQLNSVDIGHNDQPVNQPQINESKTNDIKSTPDAAYSKIDKLDNPMSDEVIKKLDDIQDNVANCLILPSDNINEVNKQLTEFNTKANRNDNENAALELVRFGQDLPPNSALGFSDGLSSTVKDQSRVFTQSVECQTINGETVGLHAVSPRPNSAANISNLTGSDAVMVMQTLMGKCELIKIPLWHSGFWVTIRTPTDAQLMSFDNAISREKVELGRATNGNIFSSEDFILHDEIFKFFKDLLYKNPFENATIEEDLIKLIKLPDIQLIAWGIATSIYPKGFDYYRGDISDGEDITKANIIQGKLDLTKLLFVDKTRLSTKQIQHMLKYRNTLVPKEDVLAYQKQFEKPIDREIIIDEVKEKDAENKLSIQLTVPNLERYFNNGYALLEKCTQDVNKIFVNESDADRRKSLILSTSLSRVIGTYGHFIKQVKISCSSSIGGVETENIYEDDETISSWIDTASSDENYRTKLQTEITRFIEDVTIALIAIPSSSKKEDSETLSTNFPHLVPLNASIVFFILYAQKLGYLVK
jgi:alpha-D-ribose 1-methylphosphonate 5-triphosphate synthase subunit PhnH